MIDHANRRAGAQILTAYLADTLKPGDFESQWDALTERCSDPALKPVGWAVWLTYDDLPEKNSPPRALSKIERDVLERCIQFLESDQEYGWHTPRPSALESLLNDSQIFAVWPFERGSPRV